VDGACSMHMVDEKYVQNFYRRICRKKEALAWPKRSWNGHVKVDHTETWVWEMYGVQLAQDIILNTVLNF